MTQATLSRDLKMLKTTKVPTDLGGYRYIIVDQDSATVDPSVSGVVQSAMHPAAISIALSGNLAVIKTRNGYASGLAYDMDMLGSPLILGTISGADTVFAAVNPNATPQMLYALFATILPTQVMAAARNQFFTNDTSQES